MFKSNATGAIGAMALTLSVFAFARAEPPRTRELTYNSKSSQWVQTPPPVPGTAPGDLHEIRGLIRDKKPRLALGRIDRFVKRFGATHALYPAALIARAEALIGRREFGKAHLVLQDFLDRFTGFELTDSALRLEFVIAETYLSGTKRKVWGVRWLSGVDVALRILDDISTRFPKHELAVLAVKTQGDYFARSGDHAMAELAYARLMRDFPNNRYTQYASKRSAQSALAGFGGVAFDDAPLIEAQERYREYAMRYPGAVAAEDVETILNGIADKRADKDFSIGRYYDKTGHLSSAVFYYELVVRQWPDTVAASMARTRLVLLGVTPPDQTDGPIESNQEGAP